MEASRRAPAAIRAALLALAAASTLAASDHRSAGLRRVERSLREPLSPGSVALLVEMPHAPAALERLGAALVDPDPRLRAIAARVINVTGAIELRAKLEAALSGEKDPVAALEGLRALSALTPPGQAGLVLAASGCLGEPAGPWLAEVLGRRADAVELWFAPDLDRGRLGRDGRLRYLQLASGGDEGQGEALRSRALAAGDEATLQLLAEAGQILPLRRPPGPARGKLYRRLGPDDLPPGSAQDILRVAQCAPPERERGATAEIRFGRDGRPRQVDVWDRPSAACTLATRVLFSLLLARPGQAARSDEIAGYIAVLDPERSAGTSADEGSAADPDTHRVGGEVVAPRILSQVPPRYPQHAKDERMRGIVRLETIITRLGSVGDIQVVEGQDLLARAAAESVALWRFSPGQLDGKPVQVSFTVTTKFTMR